MQQTKSQLFQAYRKLRWKNFFVASIFIMSTIFGSLISAPRTIARDDCLDVQFIFARGSGESLGDVSYSAWRENIIEQISGFGIRYGFYELGQRSYGGYQYPAVAVSGGFGEFFTLLGAYFSSGDAFKFGASVEQGIGELKSYISQVGSTCSSTKFVLGGYSQGAMIMSGTLLQLDPSKILYVTTFGDPKLYLPEGAPSSNPFGSPDACRGINLSSYRTYVPDCKAYEGVLGSYRPYQLPSYAGKIATWCNKKDIMCSSGLSVDNHTQYVSDNLYLDAAEKICAILIREFILTPDEKQQLENYHDLVFLFDTTASMTSMLNRYRDEAKNLASQVYAEGGRVALYEYRDIEDGYRPFEACNFSCTEAQLNYQLDNIHLAGGGDGPESLLSGALVAMNNLQWHEGATKSLVVLTDNSFHSPDIDGTTVDQVVRRSLEIDPVNIYIIGPEDYQSRYRWLTVPTNGDTFSTSSEIKLSTQKIFSRPVAKLGLAEYFGNIGEEFLFDASESYGFGKDALTYDWDLNGDGKFEITNGLAKISHTYRAAFDGYVQVRISDEVGSSTMSAKVSVHPQKPANYLQITSLTARNIDDTTAQITFTSMSDRVLVKVDDVTFGTVATTNGRGSFRIDHITSQVTVTLTPYDDNGRGASRSVTVNPIGKPTPTPSRTDSAFVEASTPTTPPVFLTAPSTGVCDRRLYQCSSSR